MVLRMGAVAPDGRSGLTHGVAIMQCCEGCGRDTKGRFCIECIGHPLPRARAGRQPDVPLEDDYSEESDADSVCDDNPLDPYGKWR